MTEIRRTLNRIRSRCTNKRPDGRAARSLQTRVLPTLGALALSVLFSGGIGTGAARGEEPAASSMPNNAPSAANMPPTNFGNADFNFSPSVLASRTYYEGAETLGRVGNEAILKRDILHQLKKYAFLEFNRMKKEAPPEAKAQFTEEAFEKYKNEFISREEIYSQVLDEYIRKLLFYNDYVISRSKEEVTEQKKNMAKAYEKDYLPHLMELMDCVDYQEMENIFKEKLQSSIEQEKRLFVQETLGSSWLEYNLGADQYQPTVTDLRRWYEAHLDRYARPERVRWQRMSVLFSNHSNRAEAMDKIVYMGNAVRVAENAQERQKLFSQVAAADSEDFFAQKGGDCDWSGRGELNSAVIEEAIFSEELPVGSLSRILEDKFGYTIVLVRAREQKHFTPFVEVQEEIRQAMKDERRASLKTQYEEALAKRFAVEIYRITPEERRRMIETARKEDRSATGRELR